MTDPTIAACAMLGCPRPAAGVHHLTLLPHGIWRSRPRPTPLCAECLRLIRWLPPPVPCPFNFAHNPRPAGVPDNA